jgi:hypothetical protein
MFIANSHCSRITIDNVYTKVFNIFINILLLYPLTPWRLPLPVGRPPALVPLDDLLCPYL